MSFDGVRAANALARTLRLWPEINAAQAIIQVGEALNDDAKRCPWIGIHFGAQEHVPYYLSAGTRPWKVDAQLTVYLQTVSRRSGEDAQAAVVELAKEVKRAVGANLTLADEHGSAVKFVRGISDQPGYPLDATDGIYFRTWIMTLNLEARA